MNSNIDMQALVGAMGDAVVVCDVQGRVVVWNPGAERIFGWTAAEAMGQRMDMIVPERLRRRHWEGYEQSMASGTTKYAHDLLRVPAVDKAGRAMSIAFTVFMLFGADGKASACGSVIRDETDRFAQDRALRKRIAELEGQLAAGPSAASTATASATAAGPATAAATPAEVTDSARKGGGCPYS